MALVFDDMVTQVAEILQNDDAAYRATIEQTMIHIYGILAEEVDFDFLVSINRYKLDLTATNSYYVLNNKFIHKIVTIESLEGVPAMTHRTNQEFRDQIRNLTNLTQSSPVVFTSAGISQGKKRIRVFPVPVESKTLYVSFQLEASQDNFGHCPPIFAKALIHGTKSLIAPPENISSPADRIRWKAVTQHEDDLFEKWMQYAALKYRQTPDYKPLYTVDTSMADMIDDANDC